MRKHLKSARMLMASATLATSISLSPALWAGTGDDSSQSITASEEHGRKVYVNDGPQASQSSSANQSSGNQARRGQAPDPPRHKLMYWSSKDNRWKPVPGPTAPAMRAARSAAAEVNQTLESESSQSAAARILNANFSGRAISQEEIDASIADAAARHNVDPNLVRAVVKVESNFNPNAVSRKGAMGLMQLMPSTARQLNVKNPFDPQQNVDAGVRQLKHLLQSYGGDIKLTLAAYNAGAGAVARSSGVPHYAETQNYVRRITNLYYRGVEARPVGASSEPVRVQRDAHGALYISNTD